MGCFPRKKKSGICCRLQVYIYVNRRYSYFVYVWYIIKRYGCTFVYIYIIKKRAWKEAKNIHSRNTENTHSTLTDILYIHNTFCHLACLIIRKQANLHRLNRPSVRLLSLLFSSVYTHFRFSLTHSFSLASLVRYRSLVHSVSFRPTIFSTTHYTPSTSFI